MKKSLFLGAMVALTAVGIVGCAPSTSEPSGSGIIKEKVTISMWVKSDINSPLYASFVEKQ